MSSADPITGPRYQFIAHATQANVLATLDQIHAANHREAVVGQPADAGPVIHGAIAGVLNFIALSGKPGDEIERDVMEAVRMILPQIIMARAMNATDGGGNA